MSVLCVGAQVAHPSPWPPAELDVGIKRGSRWRSLNSNAQVESRGKYRRSELLSFGNSGPFGVLPKEHKSRREATAFPTHLQASSQGFYVTDKIHNDSNTLRMTAFIYLYLIRITESHNITARKGFRDFPFIPEIQVLES